MARIRRTGDDEIKGAIASALERAIMRSGLSRDQVADLLKIEPGTLSKYLTAQMIPGAQVIWRACRELGMVLDAEGLRIVRRKKRKAASEPEQYGLPFIDESMDEDKVHLTIDRTSSRTGKKSVQRAEYVRVNLRIKVAG